MAFARAIHGPQKDAPRRLLLLSPGVTGHGYLMTFGWSVADLLASSLNQFPDRAPHLNAIEPPLCVPLSIGLFPECRRLVA
jgi:hypothetical protein